MNERRTIVSRVEQIVAEIVHENGNDGVVVPGARLGDDLQFDELDVVEMIMACEEAFRVDLPDDEVTTVSCVSDLVALIAGKLREKQSKTELEWKDFPKEPAQ